MQAELISLLGVFKRWLWLVILIVGATSLLLFVNVRNSPIVYRAGTTIQVTTPDQEGISVFNERNSISDRDEITISMNKLIEIAKSSTVRERTLEELGIDERYSVSVRSELGADFVFINVEARTAELARDIANVHSRKSIEHFGELRVLALDEAGIYFDDEIAIVEQEVDDAEQALTDFQLEHGIVSIRDEVAIQNVILQRLEIAQAQFDFEAITTGSVDTSGGSAFGTIIGDDDEEELTPRMVDELIATHRKNLADLAILEPQYNALVTNLDIVRGKLDRLEDKQIEADLKQSFASESFFVQLIKEASLPRSGSSGGTQLAIFGLAGSIGFSILLIFVLDYIGAIREEYLLSKSQPEPDAEPDTELEAVPNSN